MTKAFKDYLFEQSGKEYAYKIKFAVNDFTSEQKDALESALAKFDLSSMGSFTNTPIQQHPLDFPNVRNSKVFIAEFVLGYPVTVDEIRIYLSDKVGVNQQEIAVYNAYDPRDTNTEEAVKVREEGDEEYVPALGNDYPVEDKPAYGQLYNDKFLKELEDQRKERAVVGVVDNPLMPKQAADNVGGIVGSIPDAIGSAVSASIFGGSVSFQPDPRQVLRTTGNQISRSIFNRAQDTFSATVSGGVTTVISGITNSDEDEDQ